MNIFRGHDVAVVAVLALTLPTGARETTPLDSGWRFKTGDISGAEKTAFEITQQLAP